MKILSAILSIHVLFLVAAPSLKWVSVAFEKNQCAKSCSKKQNPSDATNNCCNMACNPFMVCCNFYALTSKTHTISAPFVYSAQKYNVPSETIYSDFLSDAWKPPRIV